ncbi:MAG: Npt1/Npt2 family nucleotide transporter [Vicinamibacterales bacterium]
MSGLVERLLRLHAGEGRRGLLLFAYLFLIISSFVVSKAARDALFLERYTAVQLPFVDIAIALLVGVVVAVYIRVGRAISLPALQAGSLLVLAANSLLFWWLSPRASAAWLFPVIYVWVGMFGVLAPAQVWTLANYVFTTRAAKRAFGLVGSGAIAGWIVGGFVTERFAERVGTANMLLGIAVALALSAVLVALIWRERPAAIDEPGLHSGRQGGLRESLALVWSSPYLRAIAGVIVVSSFVTTIAGWQFKAVAKAHIPETDTLAAFFGTFNFYAGMVSLALQLFLTSRLLQKFGIGFGLFVMPSVLAAGTAGLLLTGGLAAAVLLKGGDQVLRYSIDRATVELLYLPVPASQTFRAKSFIDTVVWRAGDGFAGALVLVCVGVLGLSAVQVGWVNLALIGLWTAVAVVARRQYVRNLTDGILNYRLDTEKAANPVLDRTSVEIVARRLASHDTADILYALSVFESEHARVAHPAVRALLSHAAHEVRQRAIRLLAAASDLSVRPVVERLIYDPHLEVRTEALLYLTQHTEIDPLDRIEKLGGFADYSIRASTVAFLARPGAAQNLDAARLLLDGMVREAGDQGRRTRVEAARLLAWLPDHFEPQLRMLLRDEDPDVARHAVMAAGVLKKRLLVPDVLERLGDPLVVPDAVDALVQFGDAIVGTLYDYMADRSVPRAIRREIPELLLRIGTTTAHRVLLENLADRDTHIRFRIITALNKLGQLHPGRRLDLRLVETVLTAEIIGLYRSHQVLGALQRHGAAPDVVTHALRDAIRHEIERIFRLLKVLYPAADMHSAYVSLQSDNPVVHDNALELVETVLSLELRSLLVPLLDRDITVDQRVQIADYVTSIPIRTAADAVRVLVATDDAWLQSCGAFLAGELRLEWMVPQLRVWIVDPNPLLRESARDALNKLAASQLPTPNPNR